MFNSFPETYIEQAREQRNRLLAEAERERLYRAAAISRRDFLGVALVLLAGDLLITVGQQLKSWARPAHQPGALTNAKMRSA